MNTFWVKPKGDYAASVQSMMSGMDQMDIKGNYGPKMPGLDERTYRLIDWNVEMLLTILKQVVARRSANKSILKKGSELFRTSTHSSNFHTPTSEFDLGLGARPLDEVREIIALPEFDEKAAKKQQDPSTVTIPTEVVTQVHHLVSTIASLYNDNPFHNFDHASVSFYGSVSWFCKKICKH